MLMSLLNRYFVERTREIHSFDDKVRKLSRYAKLSEYQSRVYVSLILYGPSKASDISRISGVPRTKVYEVLKTLIDRGLVEEIPTKPATFITRSPINSFKSRLQLLERKVADFTRLLEFLEIFYRKTKNRRIEEAKIWVIPKEETLSKIKSLISEASNSVTILTSSDGLTLLYRNLNKVINELAEKKLKVQLITSKDAYGSFVARELNHLFDIRYVTLNLPILYINVDWKKFLLTKYTSEGMEDGMLSDNSIVGKLIFRILSYR